MTYKTRDQRIIPLIPNHIWLRGNNRRNLFSWPYERKQYLLYLEEALQTTNCLLHNIALVTNHGHLLVTPKTVAGLSKCIQISSQRYAQSRNKRKHSSGKLFEERFGSKPITSPEQLLATSLYIDLNLVNAGVRPQHRKWSTLGVHTGYSSQFAIPARIWTPSPWYVGLGSSPKKREQIYRQLVSSRKEELRLIRSDQGSGPLPKILRPDGTNAAR